MFAGFPFATGDADAFVQGVASFLDGVDSIHQGFIPRMTSIDSDTIRGLWSMHDYLVWPRDSRDYRGAKVPGLYGIRGYGTYEEEYRVPLEGEIPPSIRPKWGSAGRCKCSPSD